MWLQQYCHIWDESLYNNSSRLETVNYCRKEFHLKCSWFLGQPLFINITVSLAASEIFKQCFTVYHHHVYNTKNSSDSMTAWKSATKEWRKWKKKFNLFLCQPGWAICMLLCYKVTRKSFFCKRLFVLALSEYFVTPERLYFSMASSENKRASFEKKEREINIIYKL